MKRLVSPLDIYSILTSHPNYDPESLSWRAMVKMFSLWDDLLNKDLTGINLSSSKRSILDSNLSLIRENHLIELPTLIDIDGLPLCLNWNGTAISLADESKLVVFDYDTERVVDEFTYLLDSIIFLIKHFKENKIKQLEFNF